MGVGEITPGVERHPVPGPYRGAWRDLPKRYGSWEMVYKRFARWQTDRTWARIKAALRTRLTVLGSWTGTPRSTPAWSGPTSTPPAPVGGSPRSRQAASRRWGGHRAGADHQVADYLRWA